ncbi:MAG: hypothetical protein A2909_02380 [Candidatus Tagabacteria bacterium RIFCSPLOWO2_01_FULL_39_11]|uniref:SHS2 domain-containing protein n=1 Tax=Candidatus Tagabacteria bacterium RIFCSPLOWO2_01_FULL_39_11 TaxID=1802295 RepID=A0A1G2LQP2_9BACT|nr:MAG: hypothetical protein A2909_02380 [Candidatus Tagabacteria bacterium RIFCSPLOWO2_01_FULL_39_11]
MSIFSGFKKSSLHLILNISNFSIDAVLVEFDEKHGDKVIEIEKSRQLIPEGHSAPHEMFNYSVSRALIKILEDFQKEAARKKEKIKSCLVVFSAPWYDAQTHIIRIKKGEQFTFSKNIFQDALKQKTLKNGDSLKFIENVIMKVLLNGYEIKNPFGKKAKTAELFIYTGAITKQTHAKVINLIKEFLNLEDHQISLRTFPIVALQTLRDFFDFGPCSLLIDFGPEITELILIKDRHIEEISSFNKGSGAIARRIASAMKIDIKEAEYALKRRRSGALEDSLAKKINAVIDKAQSEWNKDFNNALNSVEKDHNLPQNVFLLSQNPIFDISPPKFKKVVKLSHEALSHNFSLAKDGINFNNYNIHLLLEMLYLKNKAGNR